MKLTKAIEIVQEIQNALNSGDQQRARDLQNALTNRNFSVYSRACEAIQIAERLQKLKPNQRLEAIGFKALAYVYRIDEQYDVLIAYRQKKIWRRFRHENADVVARLLANIYVNTNAVRIWQDSV